MTVSDINPYIRIAIPSILPSGFVLNRRVIFDYELLYIESGSFLLMYDENKYRIPQGSILLIRPGIPHSFHLDGGYISQPHIHFDLVATENSPNIPISFKDIPAMTSREKQSISNDVFFDYPRNPFLRIADTQQFLSLFYKIIRADTPQLEKKGLFLQLLSIVIANNFHALFDAEEKHSVEQLIKNYMDAGQGLSMSLDDFSKQFSYSKYYLEKLFRTAYGISLIAYRNQKRMETARYLLCRHTVSEVALIVGYPSIFSFSRAYKLYFGVSPNSHREKINTAHKN